MWHCYELFTGETTQTWQSISLRIQAVIFRSYSRMMQDDGDHDRIICCMFPCLNFRFLSYIRTHGKLW